jgi:hypothetical protein
MGASASTLTKDLAAKITKAARDGNRLTRDRKVINDLALKDPTTVGARGTADVLTKYRNPSFISKVTNRSAKFTEVFFGSPDERQRAILEAEVGRLGLADGARGEHDALCRLRHGCFLRFLWALVIARSEATKQSILS